MENMIPFNKFTAEMQIMYNRHGLKFNAKISICNVQSIGIKKIAGTAIKMDTALRNNVANATARGANIDV